MLYPAEPPKISGHQSSDPLKAGTTLGLTCRSLGGNPQPQSKYFEFYLFIYLLSFIFNDLLLRSNSNLVS